MNRTKWLALLSLTILATSLWAQTTYKADRALFERVCTSCHDCGWFLSPRSYKGWELTVERMRSLAESRDQGFTEDEAERIVNFLTDFVGEGELLEADDEPEVVEPVVAEVPAPPVGASTPPEVAEPTVAEVPFPPVVASTPPEVVEPTVAEVPSPPVGASTPHVGMPPSERAMKRLWNPSMRALVWARVSGFAAVVCLLGLLFSGFKRRTLARRFRSVHVALALGLFVTLAIHGIVYIFEYGTPHVLWYWFGLIGFGALVTTQLQGIVRKRFHKGLLISHITGACVGLVLSILHWVWAWL